MLARLSHLLAIVIAVAAAFLLVACTASTELVAPDLPPVSEEDDGPPPALSSQEIFRASEESIVFIISPDGGATGSGIVLEGGWVLTNAHVVARNEMVRIGRSDGEDLGLHAVHATDMVFDLALVGPLAEDSLPALTRGDSDDLELGERVLLVGFPDEVNNSPTPTMTEGILTRRRFVAVGDYPFLQVDATIAPGQSGGALVNERGEMVGISGLLFGEGSFGLVFASEALWPRVDKLITNPTVQVPNGPGEGELVAEVGPLTRFGFTVEVDDSGVLDLTVEGTGDVFVDVQTLDGYTLDQSTYPEDPFKGLISGGGLLVNDRGDGSENVLAALDPGTYQILIGSLEQNLSMITVRSENVMHPFVDAEEGRTLQDGEIAEGTFDWGQDTDTWQLPLRQGDRVRIIADGIITDVVMAVRFDEAVIAANDDGGIGIYGTGALVDFVADEDGIYTVEVGSFGILGDTEADPGGYVIEATVR